MRKIRVFLLNGILLTFTSLFLKVIGLSFNVYITNIIGAEGIGLFSLIMSVYLFWVTVANSSINLASTRIVAEEFAKDKIGGAKKAMKQCISYSLILGICASTLLILFSSPISKYWLHGKISTTPFYIIAIGLPFISMSSAINGYFSAVKRVSKTAITQILELFIKIGATVFLLTILLPKGVEFACIALILGDCISEICSFSLLYFLYLLDKRRYHQKTAQKSYAKEIAKISFPVAITSYIRSGLSTIKQMIIPHNLEKSGLSCESALAQYGIIQGMVMPLLNFPMSFIASFSSLLIPEISYYYVKQDMIGIQKILQRIFKITSIFSIGVIGIFLFFSQELSVAIYYSNESSPFLLLLCPLILLMYLDNIIDSILKGLNKQVSVMFCNILDLFTSILAILIFVPHFGIYGYVIMIFISEILNFSISIQQLYHITKFHFDIWNFLIRPFASILLSYFLLQSFSFFMINSFVSLVLKITIFILLYLCFIFLSGALTKKDIKF